MKFLYPSSVNTHKPLFVYIPGLDGSGELLASQKQIWDLFDVRCVCLSLEKQDWQELTDELITLIKDELVSRSNQELYICGESFGACLSLNLMASIPNLIDRAILINSATPFRKRPLLTSGIYITAMMSDFVYQNSIFLLMPFLGKLSAIAPQQEKKLLEVIRKVPPSIVSWRLSLLQNFQIPSLPDNPSTLIIACSQDELLPSTDEAHRLQKLLDNSQVKILPESGHCCLLETPIDLWEIIKP